MNASEARARAENRTLVQFNEIMRDIESSVLIGKLSCYVYREINEENRNKLTELGFDVIEKDGYNNYLIKW